MAWHPISEDLTMDPVGDVSAVYNFEGTAEFGIESERALWAADETQFC